MILARGFGFENGRKCLPSTVWADISCRITFLSFLNRHIMRHLSCSDAVNWFAGNLKRRQQEWQTTNTKVRRGCQSSKPISLMTPDCLHTKRAGFVFTFSFIIHLVRTRVGTWQSNVQPKRSLEERKQTKNRPLGVVRPAFLKKHF